MTFALTHFDLLPVYVLGPGVVYLLVATYILVALFRPRRIRVTVDPVELVGCRSCRRGFHRDGGSCWTCGARLEGGEPA